MNSAALDIFFSLLAAVAILSVCLSPAIAQQVCLPLPRLLSLAPPGGCVGTEIEVVVGGDRIEDARELRFSTS